MLSSSTARYDTGPKRDAYFKAGRRYEARYAWQAALVYADAAATTRIAAKMETGLTPQLAAR